MTSRPAGAPKDVDPVSDWFKMGRIDAGPVAAEVVKNLAVWDRANQRLIRESMRRHPSSPTRPPTERTVSLRCRPKPLPALRLGITNDSGPEPRLRPCNLSHVAPPVTRCGHAPGRSLGAGAFSSILPTRAPIPRSPPVHLHHQVSVVHVLPRRERVERPLACPPDPRQLEHAGRRRVRVAGVGVEPRLPPRDGEGAPGLAAEHRADERGNGAAMMRRVGRRPGRARGMGSCRATTMSRNSGHRPRRPYMSWLRLSERYDVDPACFGGRVRERRSPSVGCCRSLRWCWHGRVRERDREGCRGDGDDAWTHETPSAEGQGPAGFSPSRHLLSGCAG